MDNGSKRSGVGGTRGGGKVRIILLRSREQQTRVWLESWGWKWKEVSEFLKFSRLREFTEI